MSKSLIKILLAVAVAGAAIFTTCNKHDNAPTTQEVPYSKQETPENELTKEFKSEHNLVMTGCLAGYRTGAELAVNRILDNYSPLGENERWQVKEDAQESLWFLKRFYVSIGQPELFAPYAEKAKKLSLEAK